MKWNATILVALTIATGCGVDAGKKGDDADVMEAGITSGDFAPLYVGQLSWETYDEQRNLLQREHGDEVELEVNIDPRDRVWLDDLSWCEVWLDLESNTIPEQSCVRDYWNSTTDAEARIEVTGSWALAQGILTVQTVETIRVLDDDGNVSKTVLEETVFEGSPAQIRPPGEEGIDEPRVCTTATQCADSEECSDGWCQPFLTCASTAPTIEAEWVEAEWSACDDGKSYAGRCSRSDPYENWECDCIVNDTVAQTFSPAVEFWTEGMLHREFNSACDWRVPPQSY